MRSRDDGVRGRRGICISVRKLGDAVELTCDDVILKSATPYPAVWEQKTFVTFAEVTPEEMKHGLSKKRLQDLLDAAADFGPLACILNFTFFAADRSR